MKKIYFFYKTILNKYKNYFLINSTNNKKNNEEKIFKINQENRYLLKRVFKRINFSLLKENRKMRTGILDFEYENNSNLGFIEVKVTFVSYFKKNKKIIINNVKHYNFNFFKNSIR